MAITFTTFDDRIEYICTGSGAQTLVIPDGTYRINYELVGGKGGTAGTSSARIENNPGGVGGFGQKVIGSINGELLAGNTVTLYVGQNGLNGSTVVGGNGGGGYKAGGRGGYNYSTDEDGSWYGAAGGGGGGSSSIIYQSSPIVTAGGGGGGGAKMYTNFGGPDYPIGKTSTILNSSVSTTDTATNGVNGADSGASFNGAGGGGGGGHSGGAGGDAYAAGNDITGEGGDGGEGFYNDAYKLATTTPTVSTATVVGYIKLVVYVAPSYIRYYNGSWREVSKIFIHDGTTWQQMKQVHIKNNNVWKKVFG
jgi:hypothetical protein